MMDCQSSENLLHSGGGRGLSKQKIERKNFTERKVCYVYKEKFCCVLSVFLWQISLVSYGSRLCRDCTQREIPLK